MQPVNYYKLSIKFFPMIPDSIDSFVCVKVYYTQIPLTFCYKAHIKYCLQFKRFKNYV